MGITEENAEFYRQQEMRFQKFVTGKRMSMAEIRDAIGQPVYTISDLSKLMAVGKQKDMVQIYEDTGDGFSEEDSYFLEEYDPEDEYFELAVGMDIRALRIDPCNNSCVVMLREIKLNDSVIPLKNKCITTNGFRIGDGVYAFDTKDPNITLNLSQFYKMQENILKVSMQITRMPEETVKHMQKRGLF